MPNIETTKLHGEDLKKFPSMKTQQPMQALIYILIETSG